MFLRDCVIGTQSFITHARIVKKTNMVKFDSLNQLMDHIDSNFAIVKQQLAKNDPDSLKTLLDTKKVIYGDSSSCDLFVDLIDDIMYDTFLGSLRLVFKTGFKPSKYKQSWKQHTIMTELAKTITADVEKGLLVEDDSDLEKYRQIISKLSNMTIAELVDREHERLRQELIKQGRIKADPV